MHYSEHRSEDQITGIAWSWIGVKDVEWRILQQDLSNERSMLDDFLAAYNAADVVTGHYLTRHDLPLLNDHCLRHGLPLLKPVRVQDTVTGMTKVKGLGKSQENLAATFDLADEKHRMCGHSWRVANALDSMGREGTRKRVVDDVVQHKSLRGELLRRSALKLPKVWAP